MKEAELQGLCEQYLDLKGAEYVHWPDNLNSLLFSPVFHHYLAKNQSLYRALQKVKKTISRYWLGFPDLAIFSPNEIDNHCLLIELKTKTGQLSGGQKRFHRHHRVHICRTFEEFRETYENWLKVIDTTN